MSKTLRILVSVALLAWLACRMDWNQIGLAFRHLRVGIWLAAVGLYALAQVASACRWQLLARPLGFQLPLIRAVGLYFIGMFFNLFLPTSVGGDVIRAWFLDGASGRRLPAFLSVFVDRLSGLLVLLGIACLATALCPFPLPPWVTASVWGTAAAAAIGFLFLPFLVRTSQPLDRLRRLIAGIRLYLNKPQLLLSTTVLSLIVQAANVLVVWLIGRALDLPVPGGYYWIFVPMVTLLTVLPVSMNGMGVREGGTVLFLAPLGVNQAAAVTLALLWFLVFTATSLAGGGIYLLGNRASLGRGAYQRGAWAVSRGASRSTLHAPRSTPHAPPTEASHDRSVGDHPDQGRTGQLEAAA